MSKFTLSESGKLSIKGAKSRSIRSIYSDKRPPKPKKSLVKGCTLALQWDSNTNSIRKMETYFDKWHQFLRSEITKERLSRSEFTVNNHYLSHIGEMTTDTAVQDVTHNNYYLPQEVMDQEITLIKEAFTRLQKYDDDIVNLQLQREELYRGELIVPLVHLFHNEYPRKPTSIHTYLEAQSKILYTMVGKNPTTIKLLSACRKRDSYQNNPNNLI